jgi:predicted phage-related endonuclease
MIERRTISDREAWLRWRKEDVTASVVAALFHCHPYTTALRLYAEKRGTEFLNEDNAAMRRGRWMEPAVAKAVSELRPEWRLEAATEYLRDPELRLGATPDFYVWGDAKGLGICQAKTVAPSMYERDWASGVEVPLWIILQATVEAMLAEADFIVIAALLVDAHNMECCIHEMPRNPAAEEKIRMAVAQFWRNVEAGIEPEPDFARDADTIKAMWRAESVPPIEADLSGYNELPGLLEERKTLRDGIRAVEERCEAIDATLRYAMKDAAIGTLPGWRISYKTSHFKGYTVPPSERRILRVTDQRIRESTNER